MKKLSTWLIIVGIAIFLIPLAGSLYTNYQQDQLYDAYLSSLEMQSSIEALDAAFAEEGVPPAAEAPAKPSYSPAVIGRIAIPVASIDLMLVEGTTAKDLNWGAGHMTATPMPGEAGNCAIAAHRNYTFGSYFSRLDEVSVGDLITVEYNKVSYTYEAYEILTVLPNDTSVLKQTDEPILTLITCAPKGSNTHRLIIHAKAVS